MIDFSKYEWVCSDFGIMILKRRKRKKSKAKSEVVLRKNPPLIFNIPKLVKKIDDLIYLKYLMGFNTHFLWYFNRWLFFKRQELFRLCHSWWRDYKQNSLEKFKEWIKNIYNRFICFRDEWWASFYRGHQKYYIDSKILYKDYFNYVNCFIFLQMPKYLNKLTFWIEKAIRSFISFYNNKKIENSSWPWFEKQKLKVEKKVFGEKEPWDYIIEWKVLERKEEKIKNTRINHKLNRWRTGKIRVIEKKKIGNKRLKKKKLIRQKHNRPYVAIYPPFPYKHI